VAFSWSRLLVVSSLSLLLLLVVIQEETVVAIVSVVEIVDGVELNAQDVVLLLLLSLLYY